MARKALTDRRVTSLHPSCTRGNGAVRKNSDNTLGPTATHHQLLEFVLVQMVRYLKNKLGSCFLGFPKKVRRLTKENS